MWVNTIADLLIVNLRLASAALFFILPNNALATILTHEDLEKMQNQLDVLTQSAKLSGWYMSDHGNHLPYQLHGHSAQCMALAYALGLQRYTSHLNKEFLDTIDDGLTSKDPEKQTWIALWVDFFLNMVNSEVTTAEREARWDLSCAGKTITTAFEQSIQIPINARIAFGLRTGFSEYDSTRRAINILGEVTEGYAERIEAALLSFPEAKIVALGSGGGNVGEAVRAGQIIRKAGLETELIERCDSACVLVFLGGVKRHVFHPPPDVGFHMLSSDGINPLPEDHAAYNLVKNFVYSMAVNGEAYLGFMLRSRPNEFFIPSVEELCAANIVTWAQRRCAGVKVLPFNNPLLDFPNDSPISCWLSSPYAHIINVNEYVNLRQRPDFSAPVIRRIPLSEYAHVEQSNNITVTGQERFRQSCISACQAFEGNSEDRVARDRVQQCITENMLWYEITDAQGNTGWVSRKFLEDVE